MPPASPDSSPPEPASARRRFWTRLLLGVVTLAALLNLACFAVRVRSALIHGDLAMTTGDEEFSVYPLWKVAHHQPLYEWANRGNYALTPYNFGFYEGYGVLLGRLGGLDGARLLAGGRLLTAASTLAGTCGQYFLCLWVLAGAVGAGRISRGARWWLACMAVLVWPGTGYNAWNAVSIRPDVPGAALAVWGLLAYGRSWRRERAAGPGATRALLLAAAALFYGAWSFKQSLIWTFGGVSAHALWRAVFPEAGERNRWTPLAWMTLPVVAAVAVSVVAGGEIYRFDTIRVQSFFVYSLVPGLVLLAKIIVPNGLMWLFAPASLLAVARRGGGWVELTRRREFPLWLALIPALGFGLVALCKAGAGTNIGIEGFVLVSALSASWVATALSPGDAASGPGHPGWPTLAGATLAALLLVPVPTVQLALAARSTEISPRMVGGVNIGSLDRFTAAEYHRRMALADVLAKLPKPLFTRDALFAMPWQATDNRWPTFLIEPQVWDMFQRKGAIQGDGLEGFVRARYFATLVLDPGDELYPVALQAGYRARDLPEPAATAPGAYALPVDRLQALDR